MEYRRLRRRGEAPETSCVPKSAVIGCVGIFNKWPTKELDANAESEKDDKNPRNKLDLDEHGRIVLFGCEDATDPKIHAYIVGVSSEAIIDAQRQFRAKTQVSGSIS